MFCLRNQDITDAKAFFYLFFMSNSGYYTHYLKPDSIKNRALALKKRKSCQFSDEMHHFFDTIQVSVK